jgi:hypothetical protein
LSGSASQDLLLADNVSSLRASIADQSASGKNAERQFASAALGFEKR